MTRLRRIAVGPEVVILGSKISRSTQWRRRKGADSIKDKARRQRNLTDDEEKALVNALVTASQRGFKFTSNFLNTVACELYNTRSASSRTAFGKNWAKSFKDRHPELDSTFTKPRPTCSQGLTVTNLEEMVLRLAREELGGASVHMTVPSAQSVYMLTITGVLLTQPVDINCLLDEAGISPLVGINRVSQMITAVECVNGEGAMLSPTIIWPQMIQARCSKTTIASDWHHCTSLTGHFDKKSRMEWMRNIFEPSTRAINGSSFRQLIVSDVLGFEEMGDFFHANNLQLVRNGSSISHMVHTNPTDLSDQLKVAFGRGLKRMYDSGERRLGSEQFNTLYDDARTAAAVSRKYKIPLRMSIQHSSTSTDEVRCLDHRVEPVLPKPDFSMTELVMSTLTSIQDDPDYKYLAALTRSRIENLATMVCSL